MSDIDGIHEFYERPEDQRDWFIFTEEVRQIIERAEDKIGQSFVDAEDQPFVKHAGQFWNIVAVSLDGNYCVILYTKENHVIVHKIILTEEAVETTRPAANQEILMHRRDFFGALALVVGGASKVSHDYQKSQRPKPVRQKGQPAAKW